MLMTFQNVDFDWIERESNRFAVGADEVVIALGGNPAHVSRYVRDIFPDYKFQWSGGNVGRAKWYLYEPGVYQLIFSSSLSNIAPETVQNFQRWVFEDVLPSLRKRGGYIQDAYQYALTSTSQEIQTISNAMLVRKDVQSFVKECIIITNKVSDTVTNKQLQQSFKAWLVKNDLVLEDSHVSKITQYIRELSRADEALQWTLCPIPGKQVKVTSDGSQTKGLRGLKLVD